ncbi:Hypothetical predicted protein [Lecanosticta acicola]|uniref:Uncharacterized protein n=1 Tax=Lecanosticta acicola TaxID=111012 RepID=A0AAI8Z291_9PEZI|nr:Hypothetical predicted protein [Lecanosticta acicola]
MAKKSVAPNNVPNTEPIDDLPAESHTDPEDAEAEEEFHTDPEDAEREDQIVEYHTDPEDADEDESSGSNPPLLSAELLKSQPSEAPTTVKVPWDKLTRRQRKVLRDERGISMQELRAEALKNGVLEAGIAAQVKRGVRPADKVAGARVSKTRRSKRHEKKRRTRKPEMSGKQQILESRKKQSGRGSVKRKG